MKTEFKNNVGDSLFSTVLILYAVSNIALAVSHYRTYIQEKESKRDLSCEKFTDRGNGFNVIRRGRINRFQWTYVNNIGSQYTQDIISRKALWYQPKTSMVPVIPPTVYSANPIYHVNER